MAERVSNSVTESVILHFFNAGFKHNFTKSEQVQHVCTVCSALQLVRLAVAAEWHSFESYDVQINLTEVSSQHAYCSSSRKEDYLLFRN